jgi:hypothetical protein
MAIGEVPQTPTNALSDRERALLLAPLAGSLALGLLAYEVPLAFARLTGGAASDAIIARLAGAATLGYTAALVYALYRRAWTAARLPVLATLVFAVAALFACLATLVSGNGRPLVYVILLAAVAVGGIAVVVLRAHRAEAPPAADIAPWLHWFVLGATVLSVPFGLLPLFAPGTFARAFDLPGADVFVYRLGGAALVGYAVLGYFELRSRAWAEIRSAAIMVVVFNGLGAIACALVLLGALRDAPGTLAGLALAAGALVAVATGVELARDGK